MKKFMTAALMVAFAFFGMATANAGSVYTVKAGDTLSKISGKNWKVVCEMNSLKDCSKIYVGQKLSLDVATVKIPKTRLESVSTKTCIMLGAAPFNPEHKIARTLQGIDLLTTLSPEQKALAKEKVVLGEKATSDELVGQQIFKEMLYQSKATKKVVHIYDKLICNPETGGIPEVMDTYALGGGVFFSNPRRCGNPSTFSVEPPVVKPPVVVPPPVPPSVVEPPPPAVEPEPEPIVPFHMTTEESGKPRCEVQAGTGIYGNGVYQGAWAYGENICYIWQNGEWQAGPGLYAMYGSGHSLTSDYRGKEVGVGLQAGIQRNWINDRNNRVSADLKIRWLSDRSWGSNPESGYAFTQKGQKIGLYGGYTERINKEGDLLGVTAEYWKSLGATVDSTWAQQPAQDRGSVGVAGFYETKLSQDNKWRQRIIGGVAHTNWDQQNWFKGAYEVRYDEWLMFGPQISLPIGVSDLNQPMSAHDLTTIGAFVRVELGNKVREADADKRETQLEFIPAAESTKPPE